MAETATLEELIRQLLVYGNEWEKAGHHRIYFNDLPKLYGLEIEQYKTGNISSAAVDGERVSNSEGQRIIDRLNYSKVWWDYADEQFHGRDIEPSDIDRIVANIEERIERSVMTA